MTEIGNHEWFNREEKTIHDSFQSDGVVSAVGENEIFLEWLNCAFWMDEMVIYYQ